ncbi:mite group 2 allergen-like Ixo r 2 [Dermacentor silvarum]|uniref:mite group 2 allergen-like Ixo r 2 n=1 Tax=Dermacentor silvarum TaxID=543639 RepID=UPI00189A7239|nr:mite group 2 allergen-like Ixo r 2 [Dermacentor silvarum]
MIRYVTAALLIGLSFGQRQDFAFQDCGSKAEIQVAQIEPCDSDPCILKRGSTSKIHFSIIADQDSDTVVLDARFKMFGMMMPIPGLEKDLCKSLVQCPIVKGEEYGGTMEVSIPFFAPSMKSTVQLKIVGDDGVSVCIRTNVVTQ